MCGIIGYVGERQSAKDVVIDGLKALEYRGYDSAGIALATDKKIKIFKTTGRVKGLEIKVPDINAGVGIGHTRWATHGKVCEENAHPHLSFDGKIAIVHNGVISNARSLKAELVEKGIPFSSSTDSEIIAHLLALEDCDMEKAIENVGKKLEGATTFLALKAGEEAIYMRRCGASLAVGLGEGENFVASDTLALGKYTQTVVILSDGECAKITPRSTKFFKDGKFVVKKPIKINRTAPKECSCHMRSEIDEIPRALLRTFKQISQGLNDSVLETLKNADKIIFCGCGTAYHAGLYGKAIFEKILNISCECVVASEFDEVRFCGEKVAGVFITQSGETADTLLALKRCKAQGGKTVALTNVEASSITFEADETLYLGAGTEVAVAATKSYVCQLLALYILAKACVGQSVSKGEITRVANCARDICAVSLYEDKIKKAKLFFIGKGIDFITAQEGSLKFKEITYKMTDAYQAGELKHGTIALVDGKSVVIVVATNGKDKERIEASVSELKSRGAYVIAIESIGETGANKTYELPRISDDLLLPVLSVIPLQSLALTASLCLGLDPDKPRNLAKSVTVI